MESIYFNEIDFKDRKSFISGEKIKMVPLEVNIDYKDLEKIIKERRRDLYENKKECQEILKSYNDLRGTIYVWNLPLSEDFYKEKLKKLNDTMYYLDHFLSRKNIGYSNGEQIIIEEPKTNLSKKDYFRSFADQFIERFLNNISIPNFILGVDRLIISGLKPS